MTREKTEQCETKKTVKYEETKQTAYTINNRDRHRTLQLYLNQTLCNIELTLTQEVLYNDAVNILSSFLPFKCSVNIDCIKVRGEVLQKRHQGARQQYVRRLCVVINDISKTYSYITHIKNNMNVTE